MSNGVDTEFFSPVEGELPKDVVGEFGGLESGPAKGEILQLVFTGVLDYRPNVEGLIWFCSEVLPELEKQQKFSLEIVGRRVSPGVQKLDEIDQVTVVGEVPDVRPFLRKADISISPLKLARGIQNKVLEAMACALPVVLTSQSAEGINAESGTDFFVADSVPEWCRAISELSQNANARHRMGNSARKLVVDHYGWTPKLQRLLDELTTRG